MSQSASGCPHTPPCGPGLCGHREPQQEIATLRDALVPFAFIGRQFMEPLGLAEEYDHARRLLGLEVHVALRRDDA